MSGRLVTLRATSGHRRIERGAPPTVFLWNLMLTPVKRLDLSRMFGPNMRRWHVKGETWTPPSADSAKKSGIGAVTVHHGTNVNPYINYPFLTGHKVVS